MAGPARTVSSIMDTTPLVEFLQSEVGPGPCPATGVHPWIRKAVGAIKDANASGVTDISVDECHAAIMQMIPDESLERKGFDETSEEVDRAIDAIWNREARATECIPQAKRVEDEAILKFAEAAGSIPTVLTAPVENQTAAALSLLFQPGELLTVGPTKFSARTEKLEFWLNDGAHHSWAGQHKHSQFIVPQVASAKNGTTSTGEPSKRCNDMFREPRRYVVIEMDPKGDSDPLKDKAIQAKILARLSEALPMPMIVDSGGKSLHGWFFVEGLADQVVEDFMRLGQMLGCDPAVFTKCQWVRLPGGRREPKDDVPGKPQQVVYLTRSLQDTVLAFGDAHHDPAKIAGLLKELDGARRAKRPAERFLTEPVPTQAPTSPDSAAPPARSPAAPSNPAPKLSKKQTRVFDKGPTTEVATEVEKSAKNEPNTPKEVNPAKPAASGVLDGWQLTGPAAEEIEDVRARMAKFRAEVLPRCVFVDDSRAGVWAIVPAGGGEPDRFRQRDAFDARLVNIAHSYGFNLANPKLKINSNHALDHLRLVIQMERKVGYLGAVGGWRPGLYPPGPDMPSPDVACLISSGGQEIIPKEGKWDDIRELIEDLLGGEEGQLDRFWGWCRWIVSAQWHQRRMPSLVLCLVGPPGAGKSMMTARVLLPLLGGRRDDPWPYLSGQTRFSDQITRADLLIAQDHAEARNIEESRSTEDGLKRLVASDAIGCEAKGRDVVNLKPIQAATVSVNPDGLGALPSSARDSIEEKMLYLMCRDLPFRHPNKTPVQQAAFDKLLREQLPAFKHWLLNTATPEEIASPRYGVLGWAPESFFEQRLEQGDGPFIARLLWAARPSDHTVDTKGGKAVRKDPPKETTHRAAELYERLALRSGDVGMQLPASWLNYPSRHFSRAIRTLTKASKLTGVEIKRKEAGMIVTIHWPTLQKYIGE